jgi:hypothetical protein
VSTEVCCESNEGDVGRCLPRTSEARACGPDETAKHCDESADCFAGMRCCPTEDYSDQVCVVGLCAQGFEPCLRGSGCVGKFFCDVEPGEANGRCRPESPPIQCDNIFCSGKTPWCIWDTIHKRARCGSESVVENALFVSLRCRSPANCGGDACAILGDSDKSADCATASDVHYSGTVVLCRTVSDCPSLGGAGPKDCKPAFNFPPGVNACTY